MKRSDPAGQNAGNPKATKSTSFLFLCALCGLCVLYAQSVGAHPVPFSYLDLRIERDAIDGVLVVHMFDAAHDLNVNPADRLLEPSVAAQYSSALTALLSPRLSVLADGHALTAQWLGLDTISERQSIRLRLRFALSAPPGTVTVRTRMFPYDPTHQTFLNVYEGSALTQAILDDAHDRFDYFAGTRQGAIAVIQKFLPAGIHHILIGPDHLLFLIGLLLPVVRFVSSPWS